MFPIRDHNPSRKVPYVTLALICANVLVFLWMLSFGGDAQLEYILYRDYALVPYFVTNGVHWYSFLTSAFLHAGFLHIAGNMLFLWIFGDNMEEELGHVRFLLFYLASAIAAGLAQVWVDPYSNIPMVGASGAVAGVMGGYLLMFPKARVDVLFIFIIFFRVFPIPAWIVLGIWFGLQLFNGASTVNGDGGVAYMAHVGGFLAGAVLTVPLWMRRGGRGYWDRLQGHPPHPEAKYRLSATSVPKVRRRK